MTAGSAPEILVVGAGIVGVSVALTLQQQGRQVLLLDGADPCDAASRENAAVVSTSSILPLAGPGLWRALPRYLLNRDPSLRLRHAQLPGMAGWIARFLARANAASVLATAHALTPLVRAAWPAHQALATEARVLGHFRQTGWTKLWRVPRGPGHRAELALMQRLGVPVQPLDRAGISALEPGLAPVYDHALHMHQAWSADNPQAVGLGYLARFLALGGQIARAQVGRIAASADGWLAVAQGQVFTAPHLVLAAGAWTPRLLGPLGARLPMVGERGYSAHLTTPGLRLSRPVIDVSRGFVMSPMQEGIRVSTGVELAAIGTPPDLTQLHLAVAAARAVLGDADTALPDWRSGIRPSCPDGLPAIGAVPRLPGMWLATGHGHIGFATAPVTGAILAAQIAGRAPPVDAGPFDPARF